MAQRFTATASGTLAATYQSITVDTVAAELQYAAERNGVTLTDLQVTVERLEDTVDVSMTASEHEAFQAWQASRSGTDTGGL